MAFRAAEEIEDEGIYQQGQPRERRGNRYRGKEQPDRDVEHSQDQSEEYQYVGSFVVNFHLQSANLAKKRKQRSLFASFFNRDLACDLSVDVLKKGGKGAVALREPGKKLLRSLKMLPSLGLLVQLGAECDGVVTQPVAKELSE